MLIPMKHKISLLPLLLALALLLTSCGSAPSDAAPQPDNSESNADASASAPPSHEPAPSTSTMRLRKTEGTVDVSDGEGKDVAPMDNLDLYGGYQVGTQAQSYAWIDLDSVKLTKMDADSAVEIIKDGKKLELNVKSGSVFFNVTEPLADDETLEIRTSTMLVGIRGTCGWVTEDAVGLLEGTVTVTAGDQTLTVSAGERAALTQDGELEVMELTRDFVPGFAVREILEDGDLKQAVLDASGLSFPATYEELLSMLEQEEEVVYSEVIDFEADDDPELLVIILTDTIGDPDTWPDKYLRFRIYRGGTQGIETLTRGGAISTEALWYKSCSLVERDGRLFVQCLSDGPFPDTNDRRYYAAYSGSLAARDGAPADWGTTDFFIVAEAGDVKFGASTHNEDGFIVSYDADEQIQDPAQQAALLSRYTFVRELYRISFSY